MELKDSVLIKLNESFSVGGDGVLRYQNRLCVPNGDCLRTSISAEAPSSRYSIHPGATKMYYDFKEVYWWEGMKTTISLRRLRFQHGSERL